MHADWIEVDETTLSNASRGRLTRLREKWLNKTVNRLTINNIRYVTCYRKSTAIAICLCICGKTTEVILSTIIKNSTTSCGCWNTEKQQLLPTVAALNALFSSRKADAKIRQLTWTLTKEEYAIITQLNCYYCNKIPSNEYGSNMYNGNYKYSGVDRVNNLIGYESNNCVACCKECNSAKGMMTTTEFLQWIENIYNNYFLKLAR